MAELGGTIISLDSSYAFPPGRTTGLVRITPGHQASGMYVPATAITTVTGLVSGGGVPQSGTTTDRTNVLHPETAGIADWFDRIHVLPRAKLEFGNILSQVDRTFEIYNAHRTASITLLSITNNALPGVELPNLTAPYVMPPQTSILGPTSTFNPPAPVADTIRALQDGLPNFDTSIDFEFSNGEMNMLLISGTRISLLTAPFESVTESLLFYTDIITAISGQEQRVSPRAEPRQVFDVNFLLDGDERQRFQTIMFDWQEKLFGLPLWHEQVNLTAASLVGATQYQTLGASDVDFRVGGLAVVMSDSQVFDVVEISAVTDTLVTAVSAALNAHPIGAKLMPVRISWMVGNLQADRSAVTLENFSARFQSSDNSTGALAGDLTGLSTYDGKVLFDDCNVMSGTEMKESFPKRTYRLDTVAGITTQESKWATNKRGSEKGFVGRTRAQIMTLRKQMIALRGRQKSFYMPTFIEDLTVVDALGIGASTMDIENIAYTRFQGERERMMIFSIEFDDGTSLVRQVQSSVTVDAQIERLTLDTTWPANRPVAEIVRVQFYELSRFDTDRMVFKYPRIGLATLAAPVITIFEP